MGGLIVGILLGMFASYQYAFGERELRKTQESINKNILQDLEFYRELSEQYHQQLFGESEECGGSFVLEKETEFPTELPEYWVRCTKCGKQHYYANQGWETDTCKELMWKQKPES